MVFGPRQNVEGVGGSGLEGGKSGSMAEAKRAKVRAGGGGMVELSQGSDSGIHAWNVKTAKVDETPTE
jgi:hypothetical protein